MQQKLGEGAKPGYDSRVGAGLSRGPNLRKKSTAAPWSQTWPAPGATLDLDFANDRGYVRGVGQGRSMDAVTFTRASLGRYVDQDGLLQEAANNTPRFDWASTAQVANKNLLSYTEAFDNAAWGKGNVTISANATTDPLSTSTADKAIETATTATHQLTQSVTISSGASLMGSVYVKKSERTYVHVQVTDSGATYKRYAVLVDLDTGTAVTTYSTNSPVNTSYSITDVGSGWYRISVGLTNTQSTGACFLVVSLSNSSTPTLDANNQPTYTGNTSNGLFVWGAQIEVGDTATAYQAIAQPTTSTPLAANPTCNGLLIEESRANRLLWCRDATQSNWTKTNVTAAKDQTGIDGVANAASSLTASAANGTCIQTITLASGSRTGSVFLKRITGTGSVQVSLDGTTWSTVDLSSTEWRRIVLSGTVTNPTVGIRIATNGDAVAMDYGQIEDGAFATSPILTTTASVTRSVDAASILATNYVPNKNDQGTFFFDQFRWNSNSGGTAAFTALDDSSSSYIWIGAGSGGATRSQALIATVAQADISLSTINGSRQKYAVSYWRGNYTFATNGVVSSLPSTSNVPLIKRFAFTGSGVAQIITRFTYCQQPVSREIAREWTVL